MPKQIVLYLIKSKPNTIAVHLRNIRTVYNYGINSGTISAESYPFRGFQIQTEKSRNKDLTIEEVFRIVSLENLTKNEEKARDLWLLSFYLIGCNYKDILLAKSENVKRERFEYVRSKTRTRKKEIEPISVKILPPAQQLINKYAVTKYLLCFIEERSPTKGSPIIERPLYKDIIDLHNKKLKEISKKAEIEVPL